VVVLWLIHLMILGLDLDPAPFECGRRMLGLIGIVTAPLVHGDFAHLVANSAPLLVLGAVMLFLYPHSSLRVLPAIYLARGWRCGCSAATRRTSAPAGWSTVGLLCLRRRPAAAATGAPSPRRCWWR